MSLTCWIRNRRTMGPAIVQATGWVLAMPFPVAVGKHLVGLRCLGTKWVELARQAMRALYTELVGMNAFDVTARLTLLLLIVYAHDYWYLRVPMIILCSAGLLTPFLYRKSSFWFLLTAFLAFAVSYNWFVVDNHKYLMAYWCLALCMSLTAPHPAKALAINARLLIGLCFLFAVIWKGLLSSDFVDGSFFHFTLLTDGRFHRFASFFGGVTDEVRLKNLHLLATLRSGAGVPSFVQLEYPWTLTQLARLMTWGTLVIEAAVAISFLCPPKWLLAKLRHAAALAFRQRNLRSSHGRGIWLDPHGDGLCSM